MPREERKEVSASPPSARKSSGVGSPKPMPKPNGEKPNGEKPKPKGENIGGAMYTLVTPPPPRMPPPP